MTPNVEARYRVTRYQLLAYRLRFLILVIGLLCLGAGLFWVIDVIWPQIEFVWLDGGTPAGLLYVFGRVEDSYFVVHGYVFGYLGLFFITQWLFLVPRRWWRIDVTATGRPLWRSVLSAALTADDGADRHLT